MQILNSSAGCKRLPWRRYTRTEIAYHLLFSTPLVVQGTILSVELTVYLPVIVVSLLPRLVLSVHNAIVAAIYTYSNVILPLISDPISQQNSHSICKSDNMLTCRCRVSEALQMSQKKWDIFARQSNRSKTAKGIPPRSL